mmetsp:Transcript_17651/g.68517  ORF Transcript_17651/g.68517 Transcript_17651/m.68517 type:complete len:322 (-) Transcript_17651:2032-2997(-)
MGHRARVEGRPLWRREAARRHGPSLLPQAQIWHSGRVHERGVDRHGEHDLRELQEAEHHHLHGLPPGAAAAPPQQGAGVRRPRRLEVDGTVGSGVHWPKSLLLFSFSRASSSSASETRILSASSAASNSSAYTKSMICCSSALISFRRASTLACRVRTAGHASCPSSPWSASSLASPPAADSPAVLWSCATAEISLGEGRGRSSTSAASVRSDMRKATSWRHCASWASAKSAASPHTRPRTASSLSCFSRRCRSFATAAAWRQQSRERFVRPTLTACRFLSSSWCWCSSWAFSSRSARICSRPVTSFSSSFTLPASRKLRA